jgi:competence protein ComEC
MKIIHFPLTKIILFFVSGILFSFYKNPNPETVFKITFISFVVFLISFFLSKKDFNQKVYFGVSLYILSFFIGITTQTVHNDYFQKNNYIHQIQDFEKEHVIELVIREKLKNSAFSNRYVGLVKKIDNQKSSGKIIINFYTNKLTENLGIGTNLQIKESIIKHKPINNPNQFDYGKYLINKSILAQIYVAVEDVKIGSKVEKDIWYYSDKIRSKILSNLKKSNFKNEELNVVAALILGQQQDISSEILSDYQFAGAIHILSVSGLHVGFILLFINFLLNPLPKNKLGSYTKLFITLLALWGFAVLAGMSPSVVRSVTMFSFVAVGICLKRKTNIYYTLLISLFFILLYQPSFLFDVGFQLSYIALFFILWLQPLLSEIWIPKNKIQTYFWDILTVSFAAQIGAMPLSIYYFHQFPGLFFVTNLIILPGLGIIMGLGVFVMILASVNYVNLYLSKILEFSITTLNTTISWVASFENFIIKDIPFNWYMLISLYLMIICTILWMKKPSYTKLILSLSTLLLFQTSCFVAIWNTQKEKEFIIFNVKKSTLIGERIGRNVTLYTSDSIPKNNVLKSYLVANFSFLKTKKKLQNVAYFKNKKILIIDCTGVYPKTAKANIVLITHSPKINLDRLLQKNHPELIIADASNYKSYIKVWKATCIKEKIPFHSTGEKGFYRLK